jgi:hypothetical protein
VIPAGQVAGLLPVQGDSLANQQLVVACYPEVVRCPSSVRLASAAVLQGLRVNMTVQAEAYPTSVSVTIHSEGVARLTVVFGNSSQEIILDGSKKVTLLSFTNLTSQSPYALACLGQGSDLFSTGWQNQTVTTTNFFNLLKPDYCLASDQLPEPLRQGLKTVQNCGI